MTNEKAISIIKNAFSWYEDNARESEEEDWSGQHEALRMAIKALEQQSNRCDSCKHSEERDGSNCYECVKGMADNFEAQPKTGYISIDVNKLAKEVAEKVLDEITYNGKTIREWAEIIVKQQPSEDCISREAVDKLSWCSNCDCGIDVREWHRNHYNFCPNCGADMRGENNGNMD